MVFPVKNQLENEIARYILCKTVFQDALSNPSVLLVSSINEKSPGI